MRIRPRIVPSFISILRPNHYAAPQRNRKRSFTPLKPMIECLEERIALTINYTIAPNTTLDINPLSSIIPASPAGMDRMEVLLTTIPGVSHGTIYRVSGIAAYPWGSPAPNIFTVGAGNDRITGGEGFRYVNNGTGAGTSESIPVKFRNSTGLATATDTIVITIDASLTPPTITTQPKPYIEVAPGAKATMSVVASGSPAPTYQWYTGFVPDTSHPISGALGTTYVTPALTVVQAYDYWVRVTNSGGHADSDGVTVQVANPTSVTTSDASTTYKTTAHNINLSATVSPALNVGTVIFTSLPLGAVTATSPTIVNGLTGSVAFPIPAGDVAVVGTYGFEAHYAAPAGTMESFDNKTITITPASTTTAANNTTAVTSASSRNVTLSATVTSAAGTVVEGTVTFTLLDGATVIGSATTSATVAGGTASVSYTLPANLRGGIYTIKADYNHGPNYFSSSDSTHTLKLAPLITASTAALPANATTMVINGIGFDTTAANDIVSFPAGVSGTVTAATATQLTIGSLTGLVAGVLNVSVAVRGADSASVQVATVTPVVTSSTATLGVNATTMTINGVGFSSTAANNTLVFGGSAVGTVTAATRIQLTVSALSGLTLGSLTVKVTSNGQGSSPAVQVATVIPVVTLNTATLAANATTLTISGLGFSTTKANDTVTFSGGVTGTVTAATATQLTVSSLSGLIAGPLSASISVSGNSSAAVQIYTVAPVVTLNTAPIGPNPVSLKINGIGFASTNAANSVQFFPACFGSVTASSPTQLTFTFSSPPPIGILNAIVTSNGVPSGTPVEVSTFDGTPPTAGGGQLNLDSPLFGTISIQMSETIPLPLLLSHLSVDAAGGPALNYTPLSVGQDPITHVATYSFASLFANRNYHATLSAAGLTDLAGNPMAADFGFSFFFLNGDANRDRSVGFPDLVAVAQHYGQSSVTYANGDLNGDNNVGFPDLVAVAQNYGATLPLPAPAIPAALAPAMSALPAPNSLDRVGSKSIFSVVPVSKPLTAKAKSPARKDHR